MPDWLRLVIALGVGLLVILGVGALLIVCGGAALRGEDEPPPGPHVGRGPRRDA